MSALQLFWMISVCWIPTYNEALMQVTGTGIKVLVSIVTRSRTFPKILATAVTNVVVLSLSKKCAVVPVEAGFRSF